MAAAAGPGVAECLAAVEAERQARDLYVLGAANVGKSAFISALVQAAGGAGHLAPLPELPLQSSMPGTTLGVMPVAAFSTGGLLYGEAPRLEAAPAVVVCCACAVLWEQGCGSWCVGAGVHGAVGTEWGIVCSCSSVEVLHRSGSRWLDNTESPTAAAHSHPAT